MVRKTATRRFWSAPAFGYALAAVLAIVAIGLGEWGLSRGGNDAGVLVQRPLRVAPLCA
ncbi:MAG TPA: hypothetical protein VFY10_15980 [Dehalococcoidia bacterium]|nr:hypothetical protein [Dehalococcoidia bacterium]